MGDENPALYGVAKRVCHDAGLPWTDPRTGITHQPPRSMRPQPKPTPKAKKPKWKPAKRGQRARP